MEDIEKVSMFAKKQTDLTVGESLKIIGIVTVVSMVAPLVIGGAIVGVASLWEKRKMRKLDKELENIEEK